MQEPEIDPAIVAVIGALWEAHREARGRPWSLARTARRAALPMSVLRRVLTQLQSAALVEVDLDEAGHGHASLTESGLALAAQVFPDSSGTAGP